jgi:tRNA(Ile)-lysidine synthase
MAMLRLAHAWGGAKLTALTVDHGLRVGSAEEAAQVGRWCKGLGVEHTVLVWPGEKPKTGIQAKARAARYRLMADWCMARGAAWLLTAHTADDQAETVAMRKARTGTPASRAGIWPVATINGVKVLRPLLGMRRDALRAELRRHGQAWIEDPSNTDLGFERVRIRAELDPAEVEGLAAEAAAALREVQALRSAAEAWIEVNIKRFAEGYCCVPIAALRALENAVASRVLKVLLWQYGGGLATNPKDLAALRDWIGGGRSQRRTLAGALLNRRKDHVLIGREPGRLDPGLQVVPKTGRLLWDQRFEIRGDPGGRVEPRTGCRPDGLPAFVHRTMPDSANALFTLRSTLELG